MNRPGSTPRAAAYCICKVVRAKMHRTFFVYILASKPNGTLYVGVTNDLPRRLLEHKAKLVPGLTRKYGLISSSISKRLTSFLKHAHGNIP